MKFDKITNIITEEICQIIKEGWYGSTSTPLFNKTRTNQELGYNPLMTDNGNHTPSDTVRQVSTFDYNGANFKGEKVVLSDNKFTIYKIKNFGNDNIKSTLSLFGNGSNGEKELRKAIDTINGAATRNHRNVIYRIITNELNKNRTSVNNSFYEFSLDNGNQWFILKPKPIQTMIKSKLIKK